MAEYVEKGTLHETIAKLEKLARDRYLDTPWDSPVRTRYQEQLNERMNLKHLIFDLPAADVAPVRHGRWLPQVVLGQKAWDCSECKTLGSPHWKWCPICGCKMDLEG